MRHAGREDHGLADPRGYVRRLHERTGGNPFFLEEVCEALREEGALAMTDGVVAAASGE